MSDRFAFLYQPNTSIDLPPLLGFWSSRGVSLKNPATGRVTSITQDGDQLDTSVEALQSTLVDHREAMFQLWMTADTDLLCRIRFLPDSNSIVEEYRLAGLEGMLNFVVKALIDRFKSGATKSDNLLLVVDCEGYTIEQNWDQLYLGGTYEGRFCPTVLGLPINRVSDFKQCIDGNMVPVRRNRYLIISHNLANSLNNGNIEE